MKPLANLEIEEALIGAMLLSAESVDAVSNICDVSDFYSPAYRHIYAAVLDLAQRGEPTDPLSVSDALERAGVLDAIGGPGVLVALQASAPGSTSLARYATVVAEMAQLRSLRDLGATATALADSIPEDVPGAFRQIEDSLLACQRRARDDDLLFAFSAVADELMTRVLTIAEGDLSHLGRSTGLKALDSLLDGLAPGTVTVIGGRPGMGKTVMGCKLARSVAIDQGLPVLYVSLEVPRMEIGMRMASAHCRVDFGRLKTGSLHEAEWDALTRKMATINAAPIEILDDARVSVASCRQAARRVKAKHGALGLIVIDYVQLMTGHAGMESRRVEVDQISRDLKVLARSMDIPIVVLAQLSRAVESRADKRPMLSDLREAGGLEQDADHVVFCYREELYDAAAIQTQGIIEMIVAKHRTGRTGTARCAWLGYRQDIADMGPDGR